MLVVLPSAVQSQSGSFFIPKRAGYPVPFGYLRGGIGAERERAEWGVRGWRGVEGERER